MSQRTFARDSDNPHGYMEHEGFKEMLAAQRPERERELTAIRRQIEELRIREARLVAEQPRDVRVFEERMHALLYRYVGFELFDPNRAFLLPKTTYVAQSGKYVLFGFSEQKQADELFDAAYRVTN